MSAKPFQVSLKLALLIGVAAMGIASLTIVAMSARHLQQLSYDNKLSSLHDLIALQTRRTVDSLTQSITDLGMALQSRADFRQAIFERNTPALERLIDEQFRQSLVSSGALSLQRIYVFNEQLMKLSNLRRRWPNEPH